MAEAGYEHKSVLYEETVNALILADFHAKSAAIRQWAPPAKRDGVFVDGTFGRGGHSRLLLSALSKSARLFVFDKDPCAIEAAMQLSREDARVTVIHDGFATMVPALAEQGVTQVDGVMMDLGVSSPQIDDAARGFSFMRDGPLDMRMDTSRGQTAAQWLAQASVDNMKEVIKYYGEERFAFQIAKAIDARRQSSPLCTTLELAELVANVVRTREKGQHPATRTFQAIRIHINEELKELADTLASILKVLAPQGRMAVISFHSLEDRMVKQCFAAASSLPPELARMPLRESEMPEPILKNLGRVLAEEGEIRDNPRSRSAVLRVAQRTDAAWNLAHENAIRAALPGMDTQKRRGSWPASH